MTNPPPVRRLRRWWKALAAASVLALAVLAALPWLLSTGPARSRIAARINRRVAPGRLAFEGLRLSWFGPTRLSGVTLFDPKGETVATVPSAVFDQSLGQILLGRQGPSELTLDDAVLEVERSADGSINLARALQTLIASPNPKLDLTVRIGHGSLRYRDPFLAEPSTAEALDLTLRIAPAPYPITWSLKLGQGDAALEVQGDFDRWLSKGGPPKTPELQIGVVGRRWPFVAKTAGIDATGRLDGSLDFARKRGRWVLSGDARLLGLHARGKPLSGDTLTFDRLEAGWDLAEGEAGWSIRRLSVKSPVGDLKAEGQITGAAGMGRQRIEGRIDLAEVARQLPHALRLREGLTVDRGSARLTVDIETVSDKATYDIEAKVSDLAARDHDRALTLRDPATFKAHVIRDGEASSLDRFEVKSTFLEASARGRLVDGVALEATFDLDKLRGQLGDWVDLGGLELAGRGSVTGTYRLLPAGSPKNLSNPGNSGVAWLPPEGIAVNRSEARIAFQAGAADRPDIPPGSSPRFENALKATFRNLKIGGGWLLPGSEETLQVRLDGLAESSGWPLNWDHFDARVGRENAWARVQLESKDRSVAVNAYVSRLPLPAASQLDRDVFLKGDWSSENRSLMIRLVRFEVGSKWNGGSAPPPPDSYLEVTARGRLDLSTGELVLEAIPGASPITIAPGTDGIRVSGIGRGLSDLRVDGSLIGDALAIETRISKWTGRSPLELSGRWSAIATARGDADGVQVSGKLGLDEPNGANPKPNRPTSLAVRAHYSPGLDRLDLSEFTASTAYGTLDASGRLEDPTGERRVDLKGTLAPDFAAINAVLVSKIEPGAKVEGRPRSFRASGTLGGDPSGGWKGLDAEGGFDLTGADVYGMKFGPSPVLLRAKNGKLAFDPISTTLNEGHVRLEPEIDLDAPGGPTLRLAKNSAIREARINDEVSKRVLAYVAPVLDQATRASGLVSVDLDHAEFPLGPGRGRQAKVEGAVVFENVEFAPGPLANEILSVVGRRDLTVKLDQPVTLTIADGRINQRGMAIPIGDLTRIELAGWVDFDRKLALTATLPVTAAMLGNNPLLSDIASGVRVSLPIGGTLDHPAIDQDAFKASLQELSKTLLTRGATRGAMELLMRMTRPKDPNAPPPPPRLTPEERKAQRQEKKAIRRGEVPPPPEEQRR